MCYCYSFRRTNDDANKIFFVQSETTRVVGATRLLFRVVSVMSGNSYNKYTVNHNDDYS